MSRSVTVSGESAQALEPGLSPPRRVGPGRLERGYQARIGALQESLEREGARQRGLEVDLVRARAELEASGRVERGLQRLADRLEEKIETGAQMEKRLILALGALQKENELLRHQLALAAAAPAPALPSRSGGTRRRERARRPEPRLAPRVGWLARLVRRRPSEGRKR